MKTQLVIACIIVVVVFSASQITQAQGTTYLSSLGQSSTGTIAVGSDSSYAVLYRTGGNSEGYSLNAVQLAIAGASGNPSGFSVMVCAQNYNNGSAVFPGSSVGTLSGSLSPVTAGIYTYTPNGNLILAPSTDYFVVVTAGTTVATGAYDWSFTSTFAPISSGGWGGDNVLAQSSDGMNWNYISYTYPQFAINATPVPEPATCALLGLGLACLSFWRRK